MNLPDQPLLRINVGCGQTPTPGWINYDNSWSLRLAQITGLPALLWKLGAIDSGQHQFMLFARTNRIEYADAAKKIPLADASVEIVYSSHMLEHLDRHEASRFLTEARRVLRPGGVIRLAVPDLHKLVQAYYESNDADAFMNATLLTQPKPQTWPHRIKWLLAGARNHQWLYDAASLARILTRHGFSCPLELQAGQTTIKTPGQLDLYERSWESVYIEAVRAE